MFGEWYATGPACFGFFAVVPSPPQRGMLRRRLPHAWQHLLACPIHVRPAVHVAQRRTGKATNPHLVRDMVVTHLR